MAIETKELMIRTSPVYGLLNNANILNSTQCGKELINLREAIDKRLLWGLKVINANGEPNPGFLYGNNFWLGSRSQCEDVGNKNPFPLSEKVLRNNSRYRNVKDEFPPYKVKYFVAKLRHNSTLQYHMLMSEEDFIILGVCLPATCSKDQLAILFKAILRNKTLYRGELYLFDLMLVEVEDLIDDHRWLLNGKFITITIIVVLTFLLMTIGTVYDVRTNQKRLKKRYKIIQKDVDINVQSIDDIPLNLRLSENFFAQVILNAVLSVDTFFCFGGFLVAYLHFKKRVHKNTREKYNYLKIIKLYFLTHLKRYIRVEAKSGKVSTEELALFREKLTPNYLIIMSLWEINRMWLSKTSVFLHINMIDRSHETCRKYWWRNILYIQNLFNIEEMCMSWSWYLANDMQFFVIITFLLFLSSTYFKVAASLLGLLFSSSIILRGYIAYVHDYVPTLDKQYSLSKELYYSPWVRIGPYLVGVIAAYIVVKLNNKLVLKKKTLILFWILGSLCNLLVLFGICQRRISVLAGTIYAAFGNTVWAIGIAWILIACYTDNGGVVNRILSLKIWIPLSRLTYSAFLINPFIIMSINFLSETTFHFNVLSTVISGLGYIVITYISSYVVSLMFEMPYVYLAKEGINFLNTKL
ncbi:hypothetical protein M0802_012408 [Mischocyttarus mexicanus]|nr:hypothetical protein M0802_012408 [Mischocyttarus mexicanus]